MGRIFKPTDWQPATGAGLCRTMALRWLVIGSLGVGVLPMMAAEDLTNAAPTLQAASRKPVGLPHAKDLQPFVLGLQVLLLCGLGYAVWAAKKQREQEAAVRAEITGLAAEIKALAGESGPLEPIRKDQEKSLKMVEDIFAKTTQFPASLVTLKNLVSEIKGGIEKAPTATAGWGQNDREMLLKTHQLVSKPANLDATLKAMELRVAGLESLLRATDMTRQEVKNSAVKFQESGALALDQLKSLHVHVTKAVGDLSGAATSMAEQLQDKQARLGQIETAAAELRDAANAFRGEADRIFAEGERLRKESEVVQEMRAEAENSRAASERTLADLKTEQQKTAELVCAFEKAKSEAEAMQKAARETMAAEEAARKQAASDRETAEKERAEATRLQAQAAEQKARAEQLAAGNERRKAEIKTSLEEQAALVLQNEELLKAAQTERAASESLKESAARHHALAERALAESQAARAAAAEQNSRTESIRASFWPEVFCDGGDLAAHRLEIEDWIEKGKPEAALLLSSLHRFRVLSRGKSAELYEALRDVSRRAYNFWKAADLTPEERANRAQQWAPAITARSGGLFILKVARPGAAKDSAWMDFAPGGGSQVGDVLSWAVYDEANTVKRMAEVL